MTTEQTDGRRRLLTALVMLSLRRPCLCCRRFACRCWRRRYCRRYFGDCGVAEAAEAAQAVEANEAPVTDALVVYESGYAVGSRTIQAELQPGPNRVIVGGLPATVDPRSVDWRARALV